MFCKKCGSPLRDGARFCRVCGAAVEEEAEAFAAPDPSAGEPAQQTAGLTQQTALPDAQHSPEPAAQQLYASQPTAPESQQAPVFTQARPFAPQQPQAPVYAQPQAQSYAAQPSPAYTAAPQAPAYVPAPVDWERMQPRTRPGRATALIIAVTVLIVAALLYVWGASYISPGGRGEAAYAASQTVKADTGTGTGTAQTGGTAVPDLSGLSGTSGIPDLSGLSGIPALTGQAGMGELPPHVAAALDKKASREDYYGKFTGTLSVKCYNIERLAEMNDVPPEEIEVYTSLDGKSFAVTAEYSGGRVRVVSDEFPYTGPNDTIIDPRADEDPVDGCVKIESTDRIDSEHESVESEEVWFLDSGILYLQQVMAIRSNGADLCGMTISCMLYPL